MDVCRICTRSIEDKISILDIWRSDKVNITYVDLILFCLELKIPEDTSFKTLCKDCSSVLKSFYDFKLLALRNESLLNNMTFTANHEVKVETLTVEDVDCECNNLNAKIIKDTFNDHNYFNTSYDDFQREQYLDEFETEYLDDEIMDTLQNNENTQFQNLLSKIENIHDVQGKDSNLLVGTRKRERKSKIKAVATLKNLKDQDETIMTFQSGYLDKDPEYVPPSVSETQSSNNTKPCPNKSAYEENGNSLLKILKSKLEAKAKITLENSSHIILEKNSDLEKSSKDNQTRLEEPKHKIITSQINGITVYICEYCLKVFKTEVGYNQHLETHENTEFLTTCDICYGEFKNLSAHKAESHKVGEVLFECPNCPKKFTSKKKLRHHGKTTHKKVFSTKIVRAENPLVCQYCSKIFYFPSRFKKHELAHSKEKHFFCDICSKGFNSKTTLREHLRRHYGLKTDRCKICNKGFVGKGAVSAHMVTHTKEQPYSCRFCDVKFKRKDNKDAHEKRAHPLEV